MRAIPGLALNDLRLTLRDKPAFFWLVLMPVAMMWIFGGLGGDRPSAPKVALGLDDRDRGWIARAFVEELRDENVVLREVGAAAPSGDAPPPPRTLVIPAGFTDGVLGGVQQTLRLVRTRGSNEEFGIAAQVHVTRAIARTLGSLVELGPEARPSDAVSEDAVLARFRQLAARERLVELDVSTAGAGRQVPGGLAQSVPGALTFTVLMMVSIYGAVFLTLEKRSGMLRRQAAAPMTRIEILLGKLGGRLLIAAAQIAVLLAVGRFAFGVSWGASPGGLVLLLVTYAFAVAGLSTLLGAVLRTPAQASIVGWILAMGLGALGGCWWPAEVMPGWMQTFSLALPTAWAMQGFHALISFGRGFDAVLLPSLVLAGFGLAFAAVGARFLRFEG